MADGLITDSGGKALKLMNSVPADLTTTNCGVGEAMTLFLGVITMTRSLEMLAMIFCTASGERTNYMAEVAMINCMAEILKTKTNYLVMMAMTLFLGVMEMTGFMAVQIMII